MPKKKVEARKSHWSDIYADEACGAGVREARRYKTAQAWWNGSKNGHWMEWALSYHNHEFDFSPRQHGALDAIEIIVKDNREWARAKAKVVRTYYPNFPGSVK